MIWGTTLRDCKVSNCENNAISKGLCSAHYYRLRKFGNAEHSALSTKKGEVFSYLMGVVIPYDGKDCLLWSYAKNEHGYGIMTINKKLHKVHRLVCEKVNGPPSEGRNEVAHSCGNGHLGCVNPNHLRWASRNENMSDKHGHGTILRGADVPTSKLTSSIVKKIREECKSRMQKDVAEDYGISSSTVSRIVGRKMWDWLE